MQEELITLETAKVAKLKGFDEVCYYLHHPEFGIVDNSKYHKNSKLNVTNKDKTEYITAPTQSLLQKWLREIHNIDVFINREGMFIKESYCIFIYDNIKDISRLRPLDNDIFSGYKTYEEAFEIGLQEALKLIP